ncbi:MAG: hypothetical protein IT371_26640 [Deltaproteobacteria bacterium]|nr:hypothetical protein [Deltaproteobacteria bacterium]
MPRALAASVALHLLAVLLWLVTPEGEPAAVTPDAVTEVVLEPMRSHGTRPGTARTLLAPADPVPRPKTAASERAVRSSGARPRGAAPPRTRATREPGRGQTEGSHRAGPPLDPCLLRMRGCDRPSGSAAQAPASRHVGKDRLATFRPRHPTDATARAPAVTTRERLDGLELARYEDGGRLLRNLGDRERPPGLGEVGLLTLATLPFGGSTGRQACDPYRQLPRSSERLLVLFVDTSGSMQQQKRAPAAVICAAGAALSALSRRYPVALVNFSSESILLRPTKQVDELHRLLTLQQKGQTRLPRPSDLALRHSLPRDYVIVTDTGIENLAQVLPAYRRAIAADARNRALVFVVGEGSDKEERLLASAGFSLEAVERSGQDFATYALKTLRRLLFR